ncbi:transposase [Rhizobium ruizarguesonis]|uniref:IS66 family transposase n=1 Tax=Rhizobium ruizarguesonis TaxID=2081791 RepID=UPI0004142F03|nr:transposase [Rhizobium ruizarguesonis]
MIVSDDAGQFRVGTHALCWVHAERLLHKLMPATPGQVKHVETLRELVWHFYRALKAYQRRPDPRAARGLQARFDRIFSLRTGYGDLDKLLFRLGRRKAELLRVLERPETPLHTNASERDLRGLVIKRKISGGTVSRNGRQARDSMLGLMKTCQKLGLSFWHYLAIGWGSVTKIILWHRSPPLLQHAPERSRSFAQLAPCSASDMLTVSARPPNQPRLPIPALNH